MDKQDQYADFDLPLGDFVQSYSLPQMVKVTEGCYQQDYEFSAGEVIKLNELKCDYVDLTYFYSTRLDVKKTIRVCTDHPALFKVIPCGSNDPYCAAIKSGKLKFKGVCELVRYLPLFVSVQKAFEDGGSRETFEKGDRLYLLRIVIKIGVRFLECRSIKKNKILLINASNKNGEFQELEYSQYVTLSDLTKLVPSERRLVLSKDIVNSQNPIEGLPKQESNLIIVMNSPHFLVSVSPSESLGTSYTVDTNVEISVSPREETYESSLVAGFHLDVFVRDNKPNFPLYVNVVDIDYEVDTVLQNHTIRPGMNLLLHAVDGVTKVAAHTTSDEYFAIPEDYNSDFEIIPETCDYIDDFRKIVGLRFECCSDAFLIEWPDDEYRVYEGEQYEIRSSSVSILRKTVGSDTVEVETIKVQRVHPRPKEGNTFKSLPIGLCGTFVEIQDIPDKLKIKDVVSRNSDMLPLMVKFLDECESIPVDMNPLPLKTPVTLDFCLQEDCVVVTKESRLMSSAFHIPLRTNLMVQSASSVKCEKRGYKLFSKYDLCPERISKDIHSELEQFKVDEYECPGRALPPVSPIRPESFGCAPALPPRVPIKNGIPVAMHTPLPKKHSVKGPADKIKSIFKKSNKHEKNKPIRRPPAPIPQEEQTELYVANLKSLPAIPGAYEELRKRDFDDFDIPADGNLGRLTTKEFSAFLKCQKVDDAILKRCENIDGQKFATMSNSDMETLGLLDYPFLKYFKDKTWVKAMDLM